MKGSDTFKGPCCHTSRWPKEGIDTTGKRVGVIGTGASGVQVIQEIGPQVRHIQVHISKKYAERCSTGKVAHLTVFQRTPNMALPMRQYNVSKQVQDHFKPVYEELFKKLGTTFSGGLYEFIPRPLLSDSKEGREANLERLWNLGGLHFWCGSTMSEHN